MAIEAGDGLVVHESYPSELAVDLIGEAAYKEPRHIKKAMRIRLEKEHNMAADIMATESAGGEHLPGSAMLYSGDYSIAWPTKKPDGATDLDADDNSRIAIDTGSIPNRIAVYVHETGWIEIGLLLGATVLLQNLKLLKRTSNPTALTNYGFLYTKDVNSITELFYIDSGGNYKQITNAGKLNLIAAEITANLIDDTKVRLRNDSYLRALDTAGTSDVNVIKVDNIGKSSAEVPVLGDGAQAVAATESDDPALTLATKGFIEGKYGATDISPTAYVGEESVTFPNGLIFKCGFSAVTDGDIVFAEAFPNNVISAAVTMLRAAFTSANATCNIQALTKSKITVCQAHDGEGTYWQAWGY